MDKVEQTSQQVEGEDLSGDGGIIKQLVKEGNGETPPKGCKAIVHYVGTLADSGEKFDSSRDRDEPIRFPLGKGHVIKAWDVGIGSMTKGEVAVLYCRHDYAYGEEGSPPAIPPKATLRFEVELVGWEDPEPETVEERIAAASKKKEAGNESFKSGQFTEAVGHYEEALKYFNNLWGLNDDDQRRVDAVKLLCLLNLAACQLKTEDYSEAVLTCSKALDIDTNNVKALYRRGQAYSRKNEFSNAKADIVEAIQLAPGNKELRQEYEELKKNMAAYKQQEKAMFAGIFEKMSLQAKKKGGDGGGDGEEGGGEAKGEKSKEEV